MSTAGRTLAQAKVNLALRILGKRDDGYHAIETVFQRVELADSVTVRTTAGARSLHCDAMRDENPEDNLGFRAAAAYVEETGWPRGFEIRIEKQIPIGGGLGGGSTDAAAVLRILNALSPAPIAADALLRVAGGIGADVPFLTSDHVLALGWGRGEMLRQLAPLPQRNIALIVPARGMPTRDAYARLAASRGRYAERPRVITSEMFASWDNTARHSVNEFEAVIGDVFPEMRSWIEVGARLGLLTRLSGSGSTVFIVDPGTKDSLQAAISALGLDASARVIRTRTAPSVVPIELLD
jgi:4-diphosphocytidyl-2-C-methyl-D-erythritol kinase